MNTHTRHVLSQAKDHYKWNTCCVLGLGLSQGKGEGGNVLESPQRAKRHAESKHVWSALTSVISVAEEEKEKEVQPMMVQFGHRHHQHHQSVPIMYLCNVAAHHISLSPSLHL